MPRQRQLPHTSPAPGPCDRELEAWLDAREEATDSAAEKRRKYTELLDAMIEAGVSRIPYVDPATNKRKWLAVRSEAKLVSAKAEAQEASGTEAKRTAVRTPCTEKPADPFAATRDQMASEPVETSGLPIAHAEPDSATGGRPNAPGAAGESVEVDRFGQQVDPGLTVAESRKTRRSGAR